MNAAEMTGMLYEVGTRIKALREIAGYSVVFMAEQTKLDVETYMEYVPAGPTFPSPLSTTAPASSAWTSPI